MQLLEVIHLTLIGTNVVDLRVKHCWRERVMTRRGLWELLSCWGWQIVLCFLFRLSPLLKPWCVLHIRRTNTNTFIIWWASFQYILTFKLYSIDVWIIYFDYTRFLNKLSALWVVSIIFELTLRILTMTQTL